MSFENSEDISASENIFLQKGAYVMLAGILRIETEREHFLYDPKRKRITRFSCKEKCDEAVKLGMMRGMEKCFDDMKSYVVLNLSINEPFVYKRRQILNQGSQNKVEIIVSSCNITTIKSIGL